MVSVRRSISPRCSRSCFSLVFIPMMFLSNVVATHHSLLTTCLPAHNPRSGRQAHVSRFTIHDRHFSAQAAWASPIAKIAEPCPRMPIPGRRQAYAILSTGWKKIPDWFSEANRCDRRIRVFHGNRCSAGDKRESLRIAR